MPLAAGVETQLVLLRTLAGARSLSLWTVGPNDELKRLGQKVKEYPDGLAITPAKVRPATIETYDDHRMAMSFAITGLAAKGIEIANPGCTAKTYPRFFDDLGALVGQR